MYIHYRYIFKDLTMPKVQKWGNSLALRIPKAFVQSLGVADGQEVDLSMEESGLLVQPKKHTSGDLEVLLAQMTPENLHEEINTGAAVGNELWS